MKSDIFTPIVVAAIAAMASVAGVLYNQHGALELEREKWRQSVNDQRTRQEREVVAGFAREFSASFYLAEKMIWRVEMAASSLTQKEFDEYTKASDLQKPKLATAEVLLAVTSVDLHAKVLPMLAEFRRIDEQIIVAGPRIGRDRKGALELLNGEVARFPAFQRDMAKAFSDRSAQPSVMKH